MTNVLLIMRKTRLTCRFARAKINVTKIAPTFVKMQGQNAGIQSLDNILMQTGHPKTKIHFQK